jgi:Tat protein translocase TatB subunit
MLRMLSTTLYIETQKSQPEISGAPVALPPVNRSAMIGDMSFAETVVIFVLALLIFGPKKLPEIARQVGKALNEFKRASNEFKAQIQSEIDQLEVKEKLKKAEEEQRTLPPAVPPPGAVHSSYLAPPEYASSPAAPATQASAPPETSPQPDSSPEPPVHADAVDPPVHDTPNV